MKKYKNIDIMSTAIVTTYRNYFISTENKL